jgi:hypothetical protein
MIYFLFFMLGAFCFKLFQELLSVIGGYQIFKFVEQYSITLIAELEVYRHHSLQILKLCYEEADKLEEYEKVKGKINEKFGLLHTGMIAAIKNRIPYPVDYTNLQEAIKIIEKQEKKDE